MKSALLQYLLRTIILLRLDVHKDSITVAKLPGLAEGAPTHKPRRSD